MRVLVLNGPNLGRLGRRQPEIYGSVTLADVEKQLCERGSELGLEVECRQSNHEGALIDWIHAARGTAAGIVVNPTKVDDQDKLRRECTKAAKEAGWDEPLWLETTLEDPGVGQAHQAVSAGCDIVFAAGGDGTVRLVGSALTGTDIPLGLMPQGTGNLLARNLGVSVDGSAALNFARSLAGEDTVIDVGRVHATFGDGSATNDTPSSVGRATQ